jgi:hypothetical protein
VQQCQTDARTYTEVWEGGSGAWGRGTLSRLTLLMLPTLATGTLSCAGGRLLHNTGYDLNEQISERMRRATELQRRCCEH